MTDRPGPGPTVHEEVAAYAIGALDDAEAILAGRAGTQIRV